MNLEKGEIKQSRFTFGPYQDYLIDYNNLGIHSIFRTYKIENSRIMPSPTYYVDNETQSIIAEESWECSSLFKYEFPGYGSNIVCEGQYGNSDNDNFTLAVKRIFRHMDLYLHLIFNCDA